MKSFNVYYNELLSVCLLVLQYSIAKSGNYVLLVLPFVVHVFLLYAPDGYFVTLALL